MIEKTALVLTVADGRAEVETQRASACGACSTQASCGAGGSLLTELFGNRPTRLWVLNSIQAQPGEHVVVGLPERSLSRAAALLYGLPVIGLILGALAGQGLSQGGATEQELAAALGGLLGLIAGFLGARRVALGDLRAGLHQAVILRRAGTSGVFVTLE